MYHHNYRFLDRALHRFALSSTTIADLSFDLDQRCVNGDPMAIANNRHVFISGLARAGTTMLMRMFYASGRYQSLTYRDMPFVLAPNLWQRVSSLSRVNLHASGRSHGDGMLVDGDSPESLEEVFWRVFSGEEYIGRSSLVPHTPDQSTIMKYVQYVNAILFSDERSRRLYLSKNNNNILRLSAIRTAFPNALILIPFRTPLQQAYSLLQQHERFTKMQSEQHFVLDYMTWIGRHDFGLGHRPIRLGRGNREEFPENSLNYWLQLWLDTYRWLDKTKPENSYFVCYDDLCDQPAVSQTLAKLADLPAHQLRMDPQGRRKWNVLRDYANKIADQAAALYSRLVARSRAELRHLV